MAYYGRGDYYGGMRGDYYRGDPFLGGLIAGAVPLIGKGIKALGSVFKKGAPALPSIPAIPTIVKTAAKSPIGRTVGGIATGVATVGIADKIFGGEDGSGRKRRRMNVTNVRALRRALRRAEGFEKIAQRTVSALHRGPRKFKRQSRAS